MENMGRKVILTQIIKDKGSCKNTENCGGCPIACGDSPYKAVNYATPIRIDFNEAKHQQWKYEQALKFYLRYYKVEDITEVLL